MITALAHYEKVLNYVNQYTLCMRMQCIAALVLTQTLEVNKYPGV